MPSKFAIAGEEVHKQLAFVIEEHHPDLHAIGVTFDLIYAYAATNEQGERTGPALKLHGYPCNAICRIVSLKDRVMGRSDAEILLDGDRWGDLTLEQQDGILDHELEHFAVARNVEGGVIRDTQGRPKLKMRLHDIEYGAFINVATRNGENSPEVTQARLMVEKAGQALFPFVKGLESKIQQLTDKKK